MSNMNIELSKWAVQGNMPALMFLAHIHDIAHVADDIADGDAENVGVSTENLLMLTLVVLPQDPFYREHFDRLFPLVSNAVAHWGAANRYERSGDVRLLDRSFILRSLYATLTVAAAEIVAGPVNGPAWAREVATRVWTEWTSESVGTYIQEHLPPPAEGVEHVREQPET